MPERQHHICFISDQNAPELLGALMTGRDNVHLHAIATARMAAKAADFSHTVQKKGIRCTIHQLSSPGITEIEILLNDIKASHQAAKWAVNITGGTKLMTLAAFAWAAKNHIPAFYVDTANQVVQFHHAGNWQSLSLPAILNYESLLNLYGYEISECACEPVQEQHYNAACKILDLATNPNGQELIHILNERAISASSRPGLTTPYVPSAALKSLLAICKSAGKLDYDRSQITFRDAASRQWCNGIWLEEYVQSILAQLKAEKALTSWAVNVKIAADGYFNELDAIFTAHNRLHVIECKTTRMARAISILYKADSLNGRVGGIFTRSLLCSLESLSEAEARRAENMGIKTVIGPELKNLREILIKWVETA